MKRRPGIVCAPRPGAAPENARRGDRIAVRHAPEEAAALREAGAVEIGLLIRPHRARKPFLPDGGP